MEKLRKIMVTAATIIALGLPVMAGNFTSQGTGNWNVQSTWLYTGDADGIPDADDDVLIQTGHLITLPNTVTHACNNLVVNDSLMINQFADLYIYGDYTLNGWERGSGTITFMPGSGSQINGSGSFGHFVHYAFATNSNRSIMSGCTVNKNFDIAMGVTTLTNYGTLKVNGMLTQPSSYFINENGGRLIITSPGFMNGCAFDFSAPNNTVEMRAGGNLPLPAGLVYHNLEIYNNTSNLILNDAITVEGNLSFLGTGNLQQNQYSVRVEGNFVQTGTGGLIQDDKEFLVMGSGLSAQTMQTTMLLLRNLEIDNPSQVNIISGTIHLASLLVLTSGNLNISAPVNFRMLSNNTETARIDEIINGSTIYGNMTIERYINGQTNGRDTTWADLSSPVSTTSFTDWDNEMYIKYSAGSDATARLYNESLDNYAPVISQTQSIQSGAGYEIFLADTLGSGIWSGTTLTSFGVPNTGDQDLSSQISFTSGNSNFNLVGNPFASSVSWPTILTASSNIATSFWYFDYTAGNYMVGGAFDEIPAGQGFWVLTTGISPVLIVPEAAKTPATNSSIKSAKSSLPYMTVTLKDNSTGMYHVIRVGTAADATPAYDARYDHPYHASPVKNSPSMWINTSDNKKVVMYTFSASENEITLPLHLRTGVPGRYTLSASQLEYVSEYSCAVLTDNLTGKHYDLLRGENIEINLTATTADENRFVLTLKKENCSYDRTTSSAGDLQVTNMDSRLRIDFTTPQAVTATVQVTNSLGQTFFTTIEWAEGQHTVFAPIDPAYSGICVVNVQYNNTVLIGKVVRN